MLPNSEQLNALRECCRDEAAFARMQQILETIANSPKAEEQRQIVARYQAILNAIPDRIFRVSRHGDNLDFKGTQEDIEAGVQREMVVGTNLRQFLPSEIAERCLQAIERTLNLREPQTVEYQIPKAWEPNVGALRDYEVRLVVSGEDEVLAIERDISDRKQTGEKLRQAEMQYRSIFECTSDGLVINDPETGAVIEANPAFCRMHGYTYEEIIGLTPTQFIHPHYHPLFQEYVTAVKSGGEFRGRATDVRKDGTLFPVGIRGTLFMYRGKPHLLAAVRDITEQVQADQALRESEERFRSLVEQALVGIYILKQNHFLYVNPKFSEILGYSRAELLAMDSLAGIIAPEDRAIVAENIRKRLSGEVDSICYSFRAVRKDGTLIDAEVLGTRTEFQGQPAVIGTALDVTDRNRAEAALRESEEKFSKVFQSSPSAIALSRLNTGEFLEVNESFLRLSGYQRTEVLGRNSQDLNLWIDQETWEQVVQTLHAQSYVSQLETQIRRKSGEIATVLFSAEIITFQGEACVIGVVEDITERKRSEAALRESEEKFSKVFRCSPGAIALTTLEEARILDVNQSFLRTTGYQRSEVIGHTISELNLWVSPQARTHMREQLHQEGYLYNLEAQLRKKSGEIGVFLFSAEIITIAGERCILSVTNEITERKQAEEALHRSEARNRAFLNAIPDLMFRINRAGTYLDFKADRDSDFAISPERMVGKTVFQVLPTEVAQQRMYYVERALQTGEVQVFEYQLPKRNEQRDYEGRIVVSGQDEVLAIMRDITERKRSDAQLRAAAERDRLLGQIALRIRRSLNLDQILTTTVAEVRQFLKADRVFIGQIDAQLRGRVVAESAATEWGSILTWIADDTYLQEIRSLFTQGRVQTINDTTQTDVPAQLAEYYARCQIKASLGVPIVWQSTSPMDSDLLPAGYPGQPPAEQFFGVLIVNQCSTPRRWQPFEVSLLEQLATQVAIAIQQAELYQQVQALNANLERQVMERTAQLQQKMLELQELNQMKDDFLHAVSHDLRTPIMGLSLVVNNLLKKPGETLNVSRSILERMIQSSDRQLTMINSLLETHAAETRGVELHYVPVQVSQLVQTVIQDIEPLVAENQAQLVNLVPDDLPKITADPAQLQRVFENLLTNALKHNAPGLMLTLQATIEQEMLCCSVQDNGVGMSQADANQLFDRYVRGAKARYSTGVGLGLYLCRQIITAHGGQIGVISQPSAGATFWFTLPLSNEPT